MNATTGPVPRRLLILDNECHPGDHDEVRTAASRLMESGELDACLLHPYRLQMLRGASDVAVCSTVWQTTLEFRPTLILWCHTLRLRVPASLVRATHALAWRPAVGYWDGDTYAFPYKPLPRAMLRLAAYCDCVFLPGRLPVIDALRRHGCHDIRYVPTVTNDIDDPRPSSITANGARHDVVMVGNRITSRIPFKTMPGARTRQQLVTVLSGSFGDRFAVYGTGWRGRSAQGPIPQSRQREVFRRCRLVVGNNHLDSPWTFSNRLTTAMAAGTPVVYSHVEGIDDVMGPDPPLATFRDPREAVAVCRELLARPERELVTLGARARRLALERFTWTNALRYIVAHLDAVRAARLGEAVDPPPNPWLPDVRL